MLAGLSKSICFGIAGSITTGVAATKLLNISSLPGGVKHFSVMVSNNKILDSIIVSQFKNTFHVGFKYFIFKFAIIFTG